MRAKLATTLSRAEDQLKVLANIQSGSASLNAFYQPLIAELLALRLFSIWEQSVSEVAGKVACGALYSNGNSEDLLVPRPKTLDAARSLFTTHD
ncbi:MAG: hypothetical protein ACREHG_02355, partial [Candidatus Saccharimonadales bacterium]